MDRSNVLYLYTEHFEKDVSGVYVATYTKRMVYCDVSSVSQSEWFEGSRNGLNPAYRFTMYDPDYNGEKYLEYNGKVYTIYRTFRNRNEFIELYCELNEKDFSVNEQEEN